MDDDTTSGIALNGFACLVLVVVCCVGLIMLRIGMYVGNVLELIEKLAGK